MILTLALSVMAMGSAMANDANSASAFDGKPKKVVYINIEPGCCDAYHHHGWPPPVKPGCNKHFGKKHPKPVPHGCCPIHAEKGGKFKGGKHHGKHGNYGKPDGEFDGGNHNGGRPGGAPNGRPGGRF